MNAPTRGPATSFGEPAFSFESAIKIGSSKQPPRIVLMGVEGVGKSTAGSQMEKPIFLTSEDGLIGPQFAKTPHFAAPDWARAMGFLDWLADADRGYKSVVVDTVDWFEPKMHRFICQRDGESSIETYAGGFGKGYTASATEFQRFLDRLTRLRDKGLAVLVLAHTAVKSYNNPLGENYDRFEPKIEKKIAPLLKEWADAVLFARFEEFAVKSKGMSKAKGVGGQGRIVHTQRSAGWDAKNRYGLPEEMALDMGTILEAIEAGNGAGGDSAEALANEIRSIYGDLPEDLRIKIDTNIEKAGDDAATMSRVLNFTRSAITKQTKGESNV
jgi:hypothetical protein